MRNAKGIDRKAKFVQVDKNRLAVYDLCKNKALTYHDIKDALGFSFYQTKCYVNQLVDNKHLDKTKIYDSKKKVSIVKFTSTEYAFVPRTDEQLEKFINQTYGTGSQKFGAGKYDELIASNPNLRKVSLFDTKDNSYFLAGQKDKVNRGIGSSWSLYDSATSFD